VAYLWARFKNSASTDRFLFSDLTAIFRAQSKRPMPKLTISLWLSPFQPASVVVDGLRLSLDPASSQDGFQRVQVQRHDAACVNLETVSVEMSFLEFNWLRDRDLRRRFTISGAEYGIELVGNSRLKLDASGQPLPEGGGQLPGVWTTCFEFEMFRFEADFERPQRVRRPREDISERIRVVLVRGDDQRKLADIFRKGEEYYATVPGQDGHQHYHGQGQLASKGQDRAGNARYHGVRQAVPPRELTAFEQLHVVALSNEPCWHTDASPLGKLGRVREHDHIVTIDTSVIPNDYVINVAVGLVGTDGLPLLQSSIEEMCYTDHCNVFDQKVLHRPDRPSMYSLVTIGEREGTLDNSETAFAHFGKNFVRVRRSGGVSSTLGGHYSLWAPGGTFGPAPEYLEKK
jgi:hypothetical protein